VFQDRLPKDSTFPECLAAVRVRPVQPLPKVLSDAQRADFVIPEFAEPWNGGSGKWIEAVHRLAAGIRDMLQKLRSRTGAVFVGAPLDTHMDLRASLVEYLADQHFRATPEPASLLEDRAATQKALTEAACAVHFIGGATDAALEAIEDSLELCQGKTILFQPFGAKLSGGEELFLSGIAPDQHSHRMEGNETELKKFLEELLTRTRMSMGPAAALGLVCEPADFPWAEKFRPEGLSVDYTRFLQEKFRSSDLKLLRDFVRKSQGLLFYLGRSQEARLDTIRRMVDEVNREAVCIQYLDEPELATKRQRRPGDPVYDEGLEKFLEEVRRRAGGGGG
jgi:hypothetical protein